MFVGAVPTKETNAPFSVFAPARRHDALIGVQIPSDLHPIIKLSIAFLTDASNGDPSAASTADI
jgi:hypothetical protein